MRENVTIVIPSTGRPGSVRFIDRLFPGAMWCIKESDVKAYGLPKARTLVQPHFIVGLPATRNWILRQVKDHCVVFADDDVEFLFIQCGLVGRKSYDPEYIRTLLENTASIAAELKTSLFGFSKKKDVRVYTPISPFNLCTWVGGLMGILGRKYQFNENLISRGDIDFAMRVIEGDRFVFVDNRFAFMYDSFRRPGGMTTYRTSETDKADLVKLKKEWGPFIDFKEQKMGITPLIKVNRKRTITSNFSHAMKPEAEWM